MGYGDDIMSTALAREARTKTTKPIVFGDPKEKIVYWSEVFEHNPNITPTTEIESAHVIEHHPAKRPYSTRLGVDRMEWFDHPPPEPGDLFLSDAEQAWARDAVGGDHGFVIIEPNAKTSFSVNKDWGFDRWQSVADALGTRMPLVQVGPPGARRLEGVRFVETPRFRDACAVLGRAAMLVSTDGGLVHAAACWRIPAVALWTHYVSDELFGYWWNINIRKPDIGSCGLLTPCAACAEAWNWITPEKVIGAAMALYQPSVGEMQQFKGMWMPASEKHFRTAVGKKQVLGKATYQFATLQMSVACCKKLRHAVDVGGNLGYWSMYLRNAFDHVTAYEPSALNRQCFKRNCVPGNINLRPVAVGHERTKLRLVSDPASCGHTHVEPGEGPGEMVDVVRIDDEGLEDVDLLKIDVEGFELHVVQGAERTIREQKPIICIEQKPWSYWTKDRYAAMNLLASWGYVVRERVTDDFIMAPA